MKRALLVLGVAIALSMNFANATEVAVVDVQKVVSSSAEVQAVKKEQELKFNELKTFVEKARKDVAAASDVKKKQDLETKYNNELNAKKEKMEKEYSSKLKAIEDSISAIVVEKAKEKGYDMVIAKNIVLYGGADITNDIVPLVSKPKKSTAPAKAKKNKK